MSEENSISSQKVDALYEQLDREAEASGYHLNHDEEFTRGLVEGLLTNEQRYGYRACPCRLASGEKQEDLDIICPCDYRDPDVAEFGACYCRLYVNKTVFESKNLPEVRTKTPRKTRQSLWIKKRTCTNPRNNQTLLNDKNATCKKHRIEKETMVLQTMWLCSLPRRSTLCLPNM